MNFVRMTTPGKKILLMVLMMSFFGGCSAVNKFLSDSPTERKPFILVSDPEKSGLLILSVDVYNDPSFCVVRKHKNKRHFNRTESR